MTTTEPRVWTTDLDEGDLVQTADGMMHRVTGLDLLVTIKPLGSTDAQPMLIPAHHLVKAFPPDSSSSQ